MHDQLDNQDNSKPSLQILSSMASLKYLDGGLSEDQIVDLLSDLKHRIFPRPFERLCKLRGISGLVGAEIGVCGGEHSLSLLKTLKPEKLYCIDPYSMYTDYDEGRLHYGQDQAPLDQTEINAREMLSEFQKEVVWVRKLSADAADDIREKLDFVYIDGNHAEEFVAEDIQKYWPLIKSGGVMGGHDFYNGFQSEHDGVINAVTKFSVQNDLKLKIELPDWWIVKP
ncbi:class I SAM-dependent methyltransferase [Cohaesibacter celericrescens]|uniref:class I SAM-dependent methyltransferase n=1 Tax=Cohaesibacter celericrescens TaxID=2067669 RepID=UPI00356AE031